MTRKTNTRSAKSSAGKARPNYMMDLWLRDSRGEHWTYYWKTADEYSRIDYLLVSPDW